MKKEFALSQRRNLRAHAPIQQTVALQSAYTQARASTGPEGR